MNSHLEGSIWIIEYITVFGGIDLESVEKLIEKSSGFPVKMKRLDYGFDRCVELLLKQSA